MVKPLKLPVGIENFEEIRTGGYYYVDKTKLIEQLFASGGKVNLFTRPRRFGKTLNMSMLKCFLEIGAKPSLFDGLYISENKQLCSEYYGAAEPPVRCGESHLSGLTEPPHFFIKLLCHCWVQSIYFSHREVFSWVNTFNIDLIGIIRYAIHDGIGKSTFTITDLLVPLTFTELRTKDC